MSHRACHLLPTTRTCSPVVMYRDLGSAKRAFGIARDLSGVVAAGAITEDQGQRYQRSAEG